MTTFEDISKTISNNVFSNLYKEIKQWHWKKLKSSNKNAIYESFSHSNKENTTLNIVQT